MNIEKRALEEAVKRAGSQANLAKAIGKTQGHITVWLNRSKRAPADAVLAIESATGVSRHELRPDVFGKSAA